MLQNSHEFDSDQSTSISPCKILKFSFACCELDKASHCILPIGSLCERPDWCVRVMWDPVSQWAHSSNRHICLVMFRYQYLEGSYLESRKAKSLAKEVTHCFAVPPSPIVDWVDFFNEKNWLCWDVGPRICQKYETSWGQWLKKSSTFLRKSAPSRSFCAPQYKILAMRLGMSLSCSHACSAVR